MATDPAAVLKQQAHELIQQQISTLRHPSYLTSAQLCDYQARAETIRALYAELDQIGRDRVRAAIFPENGLAKRWAAQPGKSE